ncbi:MAG TPA: hypothetical protein VHA57_13050 [Actinomycetota bacterium]|nr:hypothetical protein [Actinomycetota bacterium]
MEAKQFLTAALIGEVVVVVVAGVVLATAPDTNSDVITACYPKSVVQGGTYGQLQVIDPQDGQQCGSGEVTITWNNTGRQSPAGPVGATIPADLGRFTGGAQPRTGPDCQAGRLSLSAQNSVGAHGELGPISGGEALSTMIRATYGAKDTTTFAAAGLRPVMSNGMTHGICDQGAFPRLG